MKCRVSIPLQVAPSATPRRPQRGLEVVGNSTPGSGNDALSVLDGHRVTSTLALPSASYGRERHPRHWPAGPRGGRQPNEPRRNKLRDRRDRQPRNPYEAGRHRLVRRASGLFTGRLANVQSQAQSWLAVMSTLLGLYSAVIVVNGGAAIGELRGGLAWRISALFLAFLAYSLAFVAVVWGARSTFGPSAVCLARSPGSRIRGNRGNRDRC